MKTPASPLSSEHQDDLLLPYLEGRLTATDRAGLEAHLKECRACATGLEEIRRLTEALQLNKRAFCPHPGVLYEVSTSGLKMDAQLADHIAHCEACRDELTGYRSEAAREVMPEALWTKVRQRIPGTHTPALPATKPHDEREGLWQRLLGRVWFPSAAGAAVAAALLVMILLPSSGTDPTYQLRPIAWSDAKPKTALPQDRSLTRAAVIVGFKKIDPPLSQGEIDSCYQALEPTVELYDRYRFVTPAEVLKSAGPNGATRQGKKELLRLLKTRLDVARAAFVTIQPDEGNLAVEMELVDTATGNILDKRTERSIPRSEVDQRLKTTVPTFLRGQKEEDRK